jgi:hypothetical protein
MEGIFICIHFQVLELRGSGRVAQERDGMFRPVREHGEWGRAKWKRGTKLKAGLVRKLENFVLALI